MIFRAMFGVPRQWKEGSSMVVFNNMRPSDRTLVQLMCDYHASSPAEAEAFDLDHWRRFARAFTEIALHLSMYGIASPKPRVRRSRPLSTTISAKMMRELDAEKRWAVLTAARVDNRHFISELRRLRLLR
jgi:hypothetical protein